jgi:cation transport regulator ChaC
MNQWYFAYGSNLWIDQMAARTGPMGQGDDRPRVARLQDHRLVFNMQGEGGQVYANVVRPGDGVLGVIYCCSRAALDKLDAYERGYDRQRLLVTDEDGVTLEAVVYVAKADRIARVGKPSEEYLERIVRGARQHGLPESYIREIEANARRGPPIEGLPPA